MTQKVYEIQGYTIVLDKIAFLTRVFEAESGEGYQFNIRFSSEMRLSPRFATRSDADLERQMLIKALKES